MGNRDGTRGQRRAHAHDDRVTELTSTISLMSITSRLRGSIVLAVLILLIASLHASSPKFFQAATQADFLRGDVENLSIDNRGQLLLGPAAELVYETAAPFIWSVAAAPDGALFVGTGNEGRVFRIDAQGKGASFFDAAEIEAHALALAPDGSLYVGTSPDGKIYKVDRAGKATTFFEPGEKYIWALAIDAKGNLFAATGEKGNIYRIAPDGKGARFYQAKATHATALVVDRTGNLLVGTESPGRVLRVDAEGKAFVLLDSPFQEIRSLRLDEKGLLYAAAISGAASASAPPPRADDREPSSPPSDRAPIPSVSAEVTSIAIADVSSGASPPSSSPREDRRLPRGAIYRIAPDGLWDQLWESRDDAPYDVAFDTDGRLIVGTGNRGKLYRLEGNPPQPTLLTRAAAQQVTAFHRDARGQVYYATANPGKLFRLSADRSARGSYESEPRDAQMVATWGAISWRGATPSGTRIEISTRSGNTQTPDDTWSTWSAPYSVSEGSPIVSPKARFLQWRAVLAGKDATPVLTSVTAAYLQRNLRPEVRSITVHQPGIVFQKPFTTGDPDLAGFDNQTTPERKLTNAAMSAQTGGGSPSLGRRTYQKGLQTLIWRAEDDNDDELSFEIQYRREGETTWKVLRNDVRDPILVWDTTTVPNGTYFVKIVASDAPSNAGGQALTGALDSNAFEVDNTPPDVVMQNPRADATRTIVAFEVRDDHSPILRVESSEDGQLWRSVFPVDGIADSRTERYEIALDHPLGPRGLSLRVTDSMNNVTTRQVEPPARR
jgi:outer membrane protein assembly factor BamB